MTRARDVATQGGLVLLTPGSAASGTIGANGGISFSAVSSVSLNNIFSNTYTNYLVEMTYFGSADVYLNIRFRTSGTDNSNSVYQRHRVNIMNNSISTSSGLNGNSGMAGGVYSTAIHTLVMDVVNPFQSKDTTWFSKGHHYTDGGFTGYEMRGIFTGNTSFDGITFFPGSGTLTGDIKVYGYK